jgi:hypothetical protein
MYSLTTFFSYNYFSLTKYFLVGRKNNRTKIGCQIGMIIIIIYFEFLISFSFCFTLPLLSNAPIIRCSLVATAYTTTF